MTLKAIIPHVIWTILLFRFIPYSQSFDLVSSLLSQTPNVADKLPLPNLKSLLGSSEAIQKLLQSKGLLPFMSGEAAPKNPMELNRLLAQLKPKQGRFDPAVLDMLSAFDNNYSGQIPSIFGNSYESPTAAGATISRRVPTSTEEHGIIWSSTTPTSTVKKRQHGHPLRKTVPNLKKFSSKFRNKTTSENPNDNMVSESNQILSTTPPTTYINSIPFDHITDPNIRNHRLYDWEFETYKNFTHIDQAEDLMADESEHSDVVVVQAPPVSSERAKFTPTTIPNGWIPKKGISRPRGPKKPVESMEESQLESSGGDLLDSVVPGTYVKFPPTDSEEPKPPREPLRESSTENIVFNHLSNEDRERDRYKNNRNRYRDRSEENKSDDRSNFSTDNRFDKFRPSPPGPELPHLSPPVFVDPDQDFFTSTIRNPLDKENSEEYQNSLPGFRPPARKRNRQRYRDQGVPDPKDRKNRYDGSKKYLSDESEERFKKTEKNSSDRDRDEISKKPNIDKERASDEQDNRDRDRDRYSATDENNDDSYNSRRNERLNEKPVSSNYRPANSQEVPRISYSQKSDRILSHYPDDGRMPPRDDSFNPDAMMNDVQGTENNQQYFEPPYGAPANEFDNILDHHYNFNDQIPNMNGYNPNPEYSNNNNNNNPSKTQGDQFLAGGYDHKQYHHPFAEASHSVNQYHDGDESSWSNTFFILGGLIALSALSAFLIPTLLSSMGRQGKHRHDLNDEDLDGEYNDENTSTATTTSTDKPTTSTDPTADKDLWTEIKGVYNDVVNIVRGDYGGIVDKLTGTSGDKDGPNIVYRDDDGDYNEDDDEKYEDVDITRLQIINRNKNKNKLKNRKGNSNVKNKNSGGGESDNDEDYNANESKKKSTAGGRKSTKKNRTINSTINYMVRNNGYPVETSRGAPGFRNDTMAGFHLGNSSTMLASSTESFMGEWAKVQLIGN